ncbi:MAG: hypothetical protein ACD_59C00024G0007 [uncultured bacterium]|nr:MAG: hypothetical protein ACD_59C00024G0007 [uncultured bacterium]
MPIMNWKSEIPEELISNLSKMAIKILLQRKIFTIEKLILYTLSDFQSLTSIEKKCMNEIIFLRQKIIKQYPETFELCNNPNNELSYNNNKTFVSECSVLSNTLSKLFNIGLQDTQNINELPSIGDIGISTLNLEFLRKVMLFPEDPASFLLSYSLEYLINANISDECFVKILDYIASIKGQKDHTDLIVNFNNMVDNSIFSAIDIEEIKDDYIMKHPQFDNIQTKDKIAFICWRDVINISEKALIIEHGFSLNILKIIYSIWILKNYAIKFKNELSTGISSYLYSDFSKLIHDFFQNITHNERKTLILSFRFGIIDGKRWTLEDIGQHENLSRERVRQIENKYLDALVHQSSERLKRLWVTINYIINSFGGACSINELASELAKHWKWPTIPSDEAIISIASLSSEYIILHDPINCIILPEHRCLYCSKIENLLIKAIENQPDGMLLYEDANRVMQKFCQHLPCKNESLINYSNGYIRFIANDFKADDIALYSEYAWALKYEKKGTFLVETLFHDVGKPLHFKEALDIINDKRPINEQFSERNFRGYIERVENLLLWDRGQYIHKNNIRIPFELINKIEIDLIQRLSENIPLISIYGIFEFYMSDLKEKNILSPIALYSCLKLLNNKVLAYLQYPYVTTRKSVNQRVPIPIALEEYLIEQDRIVTFEELKKYATETLCVKESTFLANYFSNIPNLLRINRGEFIHINQLTIEKDKLLPLVDHIKSVLSSSEHISVVKIFNDKKISCKLLGITNSILLFSIIQFYFSDQFRFLYPGIRLINDTADKNNQHSRGVTSEIINYIYQKQNPCSLSELYQHFVNDLGYSQMSIYNVTYADNKIVYYSDGVFVNIEILMWTEKKQLELELLAMEHLQNRKNAGIPFGLITSLYEHMYEKLPQLSKNIPWTQTLIRELLSREDKYRIIGTQRNAFVSIPNSFNIKNLDDLLYYVLSDRYDGAANLDDFITNMREAGILKKSLTSMMLGENSRVIIDGYVVKLARLHTYVKRP